MSTKFPGFSSPAAGPEAPLEMLAACHDRMTRQCATLRRLVSHVAQAGSDEQARAAASGVMRYFDTSAIQHHQDEEVNLFPALIESMAGSDAVCLRELTQGLAQQHREFESLWQGLRKTLTQVADGKPATLRAEEVEAFVTAYAAHIERENTELLPMAARLLGDDAVADIGRAMRARRGIPDAAI